MKPFCACVYIYIKRERERCAYKPVLAREREARFNFKKVTSKCRNQEGQKRNFAKHVQGPSPPTSPPTQATAFANIAQHWLDKYKKSNNENSNKHPRSFPQLPNNSSSPAPKGSQKATKSLPKGATKHQTSTQKHSKTLPDPTPEKVTNKNTFIFFYAAPGVQNGTPKAI